MGREIVALGGQADIDKADIETLTFCQIDVRIYFVVRKEGQKWLRKYW